MNDNPHAAPRHLRGVILSALHDAARPLKVAAVARRAGVNYNSWLRVTLAAMLREGLLVSHPDGYLHPEHATRYSDDAQVEPDAYHVAPTGRVLRGRCPVGGWPAGVFPSVGTALAFAEVQAHTLGCPYAVWARCGEIFRLVGIATPVVDPDPVATGAAVPAT